MIKAPDIRYIDCSWYMFYMYVDRYIQRQLHDFFNTSKPDVSKTKFRC